MDQMKGGRTQNSLQNPSNSEVISRAGQNAATIGGANLPSRQSNYNESEEKFGKKSVGQRKQQGRIAAQITVRDKKSKSKKSHEKLSQSQNQLSGQNLNSTHNVISDKT